MALNAAAVKAQGKPKVEQPELPEENFPARLAQVVDLGVHHMTKWNDVSKSYVIDTEKAPRNIIMLSYELVDEFCVDDKGNPDPERPRWISEQHPLYPLDSDRANLTKRYFVFDPTRADGGDWAKQIAKPCSVTIAHKTSGKAKIGAVNKPMRGMQVAELKNPPKVFDTSEPDLVVFKSLPEWIQTKIKSSLDFEGGALQALLAGKPAPVQQPIPEPEEPEEPQMEYDDDIPF